MKTLDTTPLDALVAQSLAPEDLRRGDFIGVLSETAELPSFLWRCEPQFLAPHEPVRVRLFGRDGGTPLKVKAVCLPFVFVKPPRGRHRTLDVRLCRLVRLGESYARSVWKAARKKKAKKG